MKLAQTIDADIAALEQAEGRRFNTRVVNLIKAMAAVADSFTDCGRQHAAESCPPWTKEHFIEWGRPLGDPEGKEKDIVDLMYKCYLEGYSTRKETYYV